MLYADIYNWLGWPDPEQAFEPAGAGAKVYAEFASKKLAGALRQAHPGVEIRVGVIAADPNSNSSETPLALVCEFPRAANDEVLGLTHKLAWNFSRTALLITLEPHRLIAWSCYQDPTQQEHRRVCELPTPTGFQPSGTQQQRVVRDLLHWVNLITHRAQQERPKQFPADGRADALLLKNLRYVRSELRRLNLAQDHCHDLLARVIFTQFLFHRKDSDGNAFFSPSKMRRLQEDGTLSKVHADLASLLSHKTDTYALFRWMDERFNGDLFPGKDGENDDARSAAWKAEKDAVTKEHLDLLADLVSGDLVASDRQPLLWKHYSFDTIPLEFISSVYEEFLTAEERGNDKAYYTPSHLVDYVLDAVLPWNSEDWNVRILDPCCGSGIFLVKAFQRLIHRWRLKNKRDPLVTDLRPILENNLVGVDKNPEAVRVACFSLYLAMADAIEPKHYITRDNIKVFPRLRGTRLIRQDFFDEETNEIRTGANKESFDYVLGNAPWGDGSIEADPFLENEQKNYAKRIFNVNATKATKTRAQIWAKANDWPVANNDIGPLFLAKAAALVKPMGFVAMVNTASLLYWRDGQATELRKKLFTAFTFEEVTNLSALRRELFPQAIGPSCVVVFRTGKPNGQSPMHYYTPKPTRTMRAKRSGAVVSKGFSIEPSDVSVLTHDDAASDSIVWPALAMGNARDHLLVSRLAKLPTLLKLRAQGKVFTREGVIFGKGGKKFDDPELVNLPLYATPILPASGLLLDADNLPKWTEPRADTDASTKFEAFKLPQLLIKQTLSATTKRFRAMLVQSSHPVWGVICSQAYVTIRDLESEGKNIAPACIVYNSQFATYYMALTSSRVGHFIPEALADELISVPLPNNVPEFSKLDSLEAIDDATRKALGFTTADWTLIEDFLKYTLPDVLRKAPGPARFPTQRRNKDGAKEPELTEYAKTFARVVKGTFGKNKFVASTIFTEPDDRKLPVRMLTIHLDAPTRDGVQIEPIEADGLLDKLAEFHAGQLKQKPRDATGSGLGFQRIAYFFQPSRENGRRVMNLTIVKPDECRYWTRSMAMRDADQLANAIQKAARQQTK
ncbi:MAG TPA: N-6 DNA methylase [Verrucomicrobiae bacterium]|nr:N-6 DNA methylase [Verrucomicrobiae bacterium]